MIEKVIPNIEQPNKHGSCWTCLKNGLACDGTLPDCAVCLRNSQVCAGYGIRLEWPSSQLDLPSLHTSKIASPVRRQSSVSGLSPLISVTLSPFGLSSTETGYLDHYLRHISSIALAVDYTENGYRMLLPMAAEEPGLLNAMLAVSASHKCRWQHVQDTESRRYLRKSLIRLQEVILDPKDAAKESTLAIMMTLVCYEVFNGTGRWRQHFQGIGGWLKLKGDCSDLSSFLKTWICMVDTQAALNIGQDSMPEVTAWLESLEWEKNNDAVIDPLFGCSTKLPGLMLEAARIYQISQNNGDGSATAQLILRERARNLRAKIDDAKVDIQSSPSLGVTCGKSGLVATAMGGRHRLDLLRRMCATAEIFRHALIIYLFRVLNGPQVGLDSETQESVDEAFSLLPLVPDAVGPGANLGWALVILGSEMDRPDLRQYIQCRWRGLKLLELNNAHSGERLTEEVWRQHDTFKGSRVPWQDVMRNLGGEQILV